MHDPPPGFRVSAFRVTPREANRRNMPSGSGFNIGARGINAGALRRLAVI